MNALIAARYSFRVSLSCQTPDIKTVGSFDFCADISYISFPVIIKRVFQNVKPDNLIVFPLTVQTGIRAAQKLLKQQYSLFLVLNIHSITAEYITVLPELPS